MARKGIGFSSLCDEVKKVYEKQSENKKDKYTITDYDLRDALRYLEEDNKICLLGNKKVPTIRLIGYNF